MYPPGTKPAEMLVQYARHFAAVEIDASYYRVPTEAAFASMARRTPANFRFAAKLPATATHLPEPGIRAIHDDVRRFRENLEPLVTSGKLACALAQFPNSFHPSVQTHAYLGALREELAGIAVVAEFRNREWQTNETLELLREIDAGIVNVDEPQYKTLLRPAADVTGAIAYVRFHGRNYQTWWKGTNETRYDYLYSVDELLPWVDRLVDIAAAPGVREVLTFFNNHRRGQAARNAEQLEQMLEERFPAGSVLHAPGEPAATALELPLDLD